MKHFSRDNRWQYLGLVNESNFEKAPGMILTAQAGADRVPLVFLIVASV
jgi:hypothetical protein